MFDDLNGPQRAAVDHGDGPLLVLAGAGTGKTKTLAARVARLVADGTPPQRILLLTFSRRAAQQMLQRAGVTGVVGGTFHAVGNRLLRQHGRALGLSPDFSVLDSGDAADLLDLVRVDLGVATGQKRFPRKDTLASIYSRTVNARQPLGDVVRRHFPWCLDHVEAMAALFRGYTQRKHDRQVLDYDDLLLYWRALVLAPGVGPEVGESFDHVLVDEYQDTNTLQAEVLAALRATDQRLTVVGDDAQAIYGFRAATVENILRFPDHFPGATVIRLEQNYRSVQPVLDTANAVMAGTGGWDKALWSVRTDGARPSLHVEADEAEQSERVADLILARREAGVALLDQAVLFRTGHHSDHLEVVLRRRRIPFVKFGGLKFLEAAHVKDLLAMLRLLDNPADELAWLRVLRLLPGVGPAHARRMAAALEVTSPEAALRHFIDDGCAEAPVSAAEDLLALRRALGDCLAPQLPVAAQVERLRAAYAPLCARAHDDAGPRLRDLEQLELVASGYSSRSAFVTDLVLDPPSSTGDLAGPPLLDEDYLVLSTIHSAKGLEWDTVHVLHAVDGNIPSDMATGTPGEIDEERRLLYVALTRAKEELHVHTPLRYHHHRRTPRDDHGYAQRSRFLTAAAVATLDQVAPAAVPPLAPARDHLPVAVGALLEDLFR